MVEPWWKHIGNRADTGWAPARPRKGPKILGSWVWSLQSESWPEFRHESNVMGAKKGRYVQNQAKQSKTKKI